MNWILVTIFFITIIALVIFLIQQNLRDKEKLESQLQDDITTLNQQDEDSVTDENAH